MADRLAPYAFNPNMFAHQQLQQAPLSVTRSQPPAPDRLPTPSPSSVSPGKPGGTNTAFADPASLNAKAVATSQSHRPAGSPSPPPQPAQQYSPLNELKDRMLSFDILINTLEQNLDRLKSNPDSLPEAEFRAKFVNLSHELKGKKEMHAKMQVMFQHQIQMNTWVLHTHPLLWTLLTDFGFY
jgi:hypothetical protein